MKFYDAEQRKAHTYHHEIVREKQLIDSVLVTALVLVVSYFLLGLDT